VRLDSLLITDYRNFTRIELALSPGAMILVGDNAQGKSNLLEAIYLLATMRAVHAQTEGQVIRVEALHDVLPAARVVGEVTTSEGPLKIEVTVMSRSGPGRPATKTVKVNGAPKRVTHAIGRLTAVLFTADDMEMVMGGPSLRRRYLDVTLSQVDPRYAASRSRFERVMSQRNALLKRIREGSAKADELVYWDDELSLHGAIVMQSRRDAVGRLARLAAEFHARLAPGEELGATYAPSLEMASTGSGDAADSLQPAYSDRLRLTHQRDIAAGMTLTGPHRDDVRFGLNGFSASGFASRAQQRTIALSLRLAETKFLAVQRGEPPILLLDDILSEMDASRRVTVMSSIAGAEQVIVTGTDMEAFPESFRSTAKLFAVERGSVRSLTGERAPA